VPGANQYKASDFIDAIPGTGGIISAIASKVPCAWHTAKKYIVNYPTVARAYDDECQKIGDMAESGLYRALRTVKDKKGTVTKEGEPWAIKFYLTTKARDRGYVVKQELDVTSGGEPIKLTWGEPIIEPDE